MGKIAAGTDFGQQVAQPAAASDFAMPRAAFGSTQGLDRIGAEMQAAGMQQARQEQQLYLQQQHEQKLAREKADAAVAQSKLYGIRDGLTDTINQLDQEVQDGRIDKTAVAKEWQDRSSKLLAAGIDGVPESHRQFVQIDAQGLSERLTSKVGDIVRRRDQTDTKAALGQTLEHTQRLAVTDPEKARAIMDQTLDGLGPAAGLRPDQIATEKQRWIEGTSYTRAFTAVNVAKNDNKALDVVERWLADNQEIDPQRKAQLLTQVSGYRAANEASALRRAQHAEIVAQRVQRESSAAFNVLSGWAMSGKAPDATASSTLVSKLTPTDAAAYRAMAADIPTRTAAAMQPLDAQQHQIDQLYAQRNANGTNERLEQEIQRREQVLQQSRKDYKDEPLRAASERGVLDAPVRPLNMASIDTAITGLAERVDQARTASTRAGAPVSPLLKDEASRVSDMLNALPVGQRAMWVGKISQALPPEMSHALALQINDKDKALRYAFEDAATQTTAGRSVSELYLRGAQAKKDGTSLKNEKQPDLKESQWSARFSEELSGTFPNQQVADAARDRALLISHAIASENGGKLDTKDMDRALRLALGSGELVARGQMVTKNGKQAQALIPLPPGVSEDDLDKRLRTLAPADLAGQAGDGKVRAGGVEMPVADFLKTLPGQPLMPVRPGQYAPIVGGRPVLNSQGRPIIIKVN